MTTYRAVPVTGAELLKAQAEGKNMMEFLNGQKGFEVVLEDDDHEGGEYAEVQADNLGIGWSKEHKAIAIKLSHEDDGDTVAIVALIDNLDQAEDMLRALQRGIEDLKSLS